MGNPFLGVFFHWLGGLASGSFYVPYRGVKKWSWETYWLVGGFFSWIICPWAFAYFMTNDLFGVLKQQSAGTLFWTYFFGLLWGFGGLTYGLTMRFLGLSLGTGVALGYCAAFGTLVPPVFKWLTPNFTVFSGGASIIEIVKSTSGQVTLAGVGICLVGIAIAWGLAIVGTLIILKFVDVVIGLRVTEEHETQGLDLSQPLTAGQFKTLEQALGKYGVLSYPKQILTSVQLRDFARTFGTLVSATNCSFVVDHLRKHSCLKAKSCFSGCICQCCNSSVVQKSASVKDNVFDAGF